MVAGVSNGNIKSAPDASTLCPWMTVEQVRVVLGCVVVAKDKLSPEDRRHAHLAELSMLATLNGSDRMQMPHRPSQVIR